MPDQIRLQVYLAKCGIASRRKSEEIIAQGRVTVNGKYVLQPGTKVTDEDIITYDGRKIRPAKQNIYIALHKPSKFLCSTTDPDERPLAIDLITPVIKQRLFYVGRLDYLTSGLIFFTNDGDFAKKMTHPSTHIEKEYVVTTKDEIPVELMEEFKKGIYVQGERFKMKDYEFKGTRCVHIILEEGKNRELRKVFLSRNVSVKKVHRIRIGCVDLKGIHSGHLRKLTDKEVRTLLKAADAKGDANSKPKKKSISHIKTVEKQLNALEAKKASEADNIEDSESKTLKKKPSVKKSTGKRSFDRGSSKGDFEKKDSYQKRSSGKRSFDKSNPKNESDRNDSYKKRSSGKRNFSRSNSVEDKYNRPNSKPSNRRYKKNSNSNNDSFENREPKHSKKISRKSNFSRKQNKK